MGEWRLTAGVFIFIWRINCSLNGGITTPPVDNVVFQDHEATFICTAINTPFIVWKVNGTDLTDFPSDIQADFSRDGMRENNEETIVLVVHSRRKYNNTQIQCEARNLDLELIQTEMAILRIQDLLQAVNILNYAISEDFIISISWSPPFTLNVTGIEPDIWYTVEVIDSTDNISSPTPCSSPPYFNCYLLFGTNYTFYPDSPSPCNEYSFTIIPINGVGEGERSEEVNIVDTSDRFDFFVSDVQRNLTFIDDSAFSIQFVITGSRGLCAFKYVMNATGEKEGKPYNYTSQAFYFTRNTVLFTVLANELPYDAQYRMTLAAKHKNGSCLWSRQYPLSTFDVQSAAIEVVNGTITISEKFALNSRATGCFIVTSCNVGINKFMAVPINDGAGTVSGLEPGICAVLVYDLERNGKPGIRPAAEIETIQVNGSSEEMILESDVLDNVKLSVGEVDCDFKMGSDSIGCVVICFSNDDTSLIIQNFSSKDAFPMPVNLRDRLICAVFGSVDGILEKHPSLIVELSESPNRDGDCALLSRYIAAMVTVLVVGILGATCLGATCFGPTCVRMWRKRKKNVVSKQAKQETKKSEVKRKIVTEVFCIKKEDDEHAQETTEPQYLQDQSHFPVVAEESQAVEKAMTVARSRSGDEADPYDTHPRQSTLMWSFTGSSESDGDDLLQISTLHTDHPQSDSHRVDVETGHEADDTDRSGENTFTAQCADNGDESSPHDNSFNASGESLVSCETNGFGSQVCFKESKIPATSAKGYCWDVEKSTQYWSQFYDCTPRHRVPHHRVP